MKLTKITDIKENDYLYTCINSDEWTQYYIFKLCEINNDEILIKKGYMFNVPKFHSKSFLYVIEDISLNLNKIQKIYVLSYTEYNNTYYTFLINDRKFPEELPIKLIQDI